MIDPNGQMRMTTIGNDFDHDQSLIVQSVGVVECSAASRAYGFTSQDPSVTLFLWQQKRAVLLQAPRVCYPGGSLWRKLPVSRSDER